MASCVTRVPMVFQCHDKGGTKGAAKFNVNIISDSSSAPLTLKCTDTPLLKLLIINYIYLKIPFAGTYNTDFFFVCISTGVAPSEWKMFMKK